MASGYKDTTDGADFPINLLDQGDWRADIFNYLKDLAQGAPKKTRYKVACTYNKKVKLKEFQVGDLVWEVVLPLGTKDATYGKWSPNWHGPYRVDQVLLGNAYMLEELDGVKFPVAINGQHLKKYFPSMWEDE
jgi:hypothetical protein